MSSTRSLYDQKNTQAQNKIDNDIGLYPLSMDNSENNGKCFSMNDQGSTNGNSSGDRSCSLVNRVINDSHLTRDALSHKGIKVERNLEKQECNLNQDCDSKTAPENTRLSNPIDNFRGLSTFGLQIRDIPDETSRNCNIPMLRIGVNTVLNAKDNFKSN